MNFQLASVTFSERMEQSSIVTDSQANAHACRTLLVFDAMSALRIIGRSRVEKVVKLVTAMRSVREANNVTR